MAYRLCENKQCCAGLGKPRIQDDLRGGQVCGVCGMVQHEQSQSEKEWLIDLEERLTEIEGVLNRLMLIEERLDRLEENQRDLITQVYC